MASDDPARLGTARNDVGRRGTTRDDAERHGAVAPLTDRPSNNLWRRCEEARPDSCHAGFYLSTPPDSSSRTLKKSDPGDKSRG